MHLTPCHVLPEQNVIALHPSSTLESWNRERFLSGTETGKAATSALQTCMKHWRQPPAPCKHCCRALTACWQHQESTEGQTAPADGSARWQWMFTAKREKRGKRRL